MTKKIVFDFGGKKAVKKVARKNLSKGLAIGTAAGTAFWALAGLLFAPKSGKETRQDIANGVTTTAKKAAEEVKTGSIKLGEKVEAVVSEGKKKIFKKCSSCCDTENAEDITIEEASIAEEKTEE
jgi:gas vesicle protein